MCRRRDTLQLLGSESAPSLELIHRPGKTEASDKWYSATMGLEDAMLRVMLAQDPFVLGYTACILKALVGRNLESISNELLF